MKDKEICDGTNEEKMAFKLGEEDEAYGNEFDSTKDKVKFVNGGTAGDGEACAVVDVQGDTHIENDREFVGLSKAELMKYADDPHWKRVRMILLILFWFVWLAMLVAAIVIIVLAPKCPPKPDLQWWQTSSIYQVYPRSFKDTNGDGVGDLKGVHEKLGYLRDELNASVIYMNPIYPSPDSDTGYDITDFKAIDSRFGTMEEFDSMKTAMHKKGMKLILDFVPNHTSKKHEWFVKSQNREDPYTNYYVWHAGIPTSNPDEQPLPPNNWRSASTDEGAWEWDSVRGEYYLHQFLADQPDLNLRNPDVQRELREVLSFWMENGVDGFRVINAANLFETANLTLDEPSISADVTYDALNHIHTTYQPETFEILTQWRELIDTKGSQDGRARALIVGAGDTANQTAAMISYNGQPGASFAANLALTGLKQDCDATCVHDLVKSYMDVAKPRAIWPSWQTGNQDNSRLQTRMGDDEKLNVLVMMLFTLPGTPITYYGEEIGMHDVNVPDNLKKDMAGDRDGQRTPMQWDSTKFAGFTSGNTSWLPVADDYMTRNVKMQEADGAGVTILDVYKNMAAIRQQPSFQWGDFKSAVINDLYFYVRQAVGYPGFLVALNMGDSSINVDFTSRAPSGAVIPNKAKVVATSGNIPDHQRTSDLAVGNKVKLGNLFMGPNEGLVFEWEKDAVEK